MLRWLSPRRLSRFTHVVPLGLSCRVTHQARTYFRSATAYPFDWWISSMEGLARYLLAPDPERVYGEAALAERIRDGAVTTIHVPEYDFRLFHEFPRQPGTPPPGSVAPVAAGWRAHVAAARARHEQRLERLLALNRAGNRLLFVRDRPDPEPARADPETAVAALGRALATRFAAAHVQLLLVNFPAGVAAAPGVHHVRFDDVVGPPPDGWRGDDARWATAFRAAGLRPLRAFGRRRAAPVPG